jgi:hypothetical protein
VGWGQRVDKVDASTKATTMATTARMSMTNEMDGNLIPTVDAAQRNGTSDGGGGGLDNDNVEYNHAGPGEVEGRH